MAELWPYAAEGSAAELLEWRTDVLQGARREQRLALRGAPREVLTLRARLDGAGLAAALALARRGIAGDWIVPLWPMAARLGADLRADDTDLAVPTLHADYRAPGAAVAAVAAAGDGRAHRLAISAVEPGSLTLAAPAGVDLTRPVIAPARRARLLTPLEIERRHADRAEVTARFLLQDGADLSGLRGTALYIAIDTSTSMAGARIAAAMAAVRALVLDLAETVPPVLRNDVCIVLWNAAVSGLKLCRDADRPALDALAAWLAQPVALGSATDFAVGLSAAPAFFAGAGKRRRIVLFVTDGEPFPASSAAAAVALRDTIADVEVYGVNIALANTAWTAMLDNTPADGVPVIAPGDPKALRDTLLATLMGIPRHRGLDVLTDPGVLRRPLAETLTQDREAVDSGLGPVAFEPLRDLVARGAVVTLRDAGLGGTWSRRRWLHRLRGRQRALWLPTWGRELVLQAPVAADATALVAAPAGGPADWPADTPADTPADWIGQHLMIDHPTGPVFREITAADADPLGLRLAIAAPGKALAVATPLHRLLKVRSDADRIDLVHGPYRTELSLPLIEIAA